MNSLFLDMRYGYGVVDRRYIHGTLVSTKLYEITFASWGEWVVCEWELAEVEPRQRVVLHISRTRVLFDLFERPRAVFDPVPPKRRRQTQN